MPQLIATLQSAPTERVKPEWLERTIVFRRPGGNVVTIDGWVYGTLAIHATWDSSDLQPVTITHMPSRLAVARLSDVDEALAQVEWLWDVCPLQWVEETVNPTQLPAEITQWAQEHQR